MCIRDSTNTTRAANTSPTAASAGADMNGKAAEIACHNILDRLKKVAAEKLNIKDASLIEIKDEIISINGNLALTWTQLVQAAFLSRTNLSSQAQYAVPGIFFDRTINKGRPFAYYAIGTAVVEVTLDCLRGIYELS